MFKQLTEQLQLFIEKEESLDNFLPYIKTSLKGIKGIYPVNIYADKENNIINIPVNNGSNITNIREQIVKRLKNGWVKDYIENFRFIGNCFEIKIK